MIASILLIGCNQPHKSSKENLALIEKYVQSVEDMDYTTMESLLAENYMGYGPSITDSINKEDAVASWKYNVNHIYEKIEYLKSKNATILVDSGDNKGDWVSNWAELHIVFKSDQSDVTILANTIYQIENGQIVKSISFYNEADVLEQLGYSFY